MDFGSFREDSGVAASSESPSLKGRTDAARFSQSPQDNIRESSIRGEIVGRVEQKMDTPSGVRFSGPRFAA